MSGERYQPEILKAREVAALLNVSRSWIYRQLQRGDCDFPLPVRLGRQATGWHRFEIDTWLASRPRGVR